MSTMVRLVKRYNLPSFRFLEDVQSSLGRPPGFIGAILNSQKASQLYWIMDLLVLYECLIINRSWSILIRKVAWHMHGKFVNVLGYA